MALNADKSTNDRPDLFDMQERLALARFCLETNNVVEALRVLKPVLQGSQVPIEGIGLAALIYNQLRLFDRAEEFYLKYLEARPDATLERVQLGLVQAQLGKVKAALAVWDGVLKEYPGFFMALLYKGMALIQEGKPLEGRQALEAVLRSASTSSPQFAQAKEILQGLALDPRFGSSAKDKVPPAASKIPTISGIPGLSRTS